jgi:hypothetical protein
MAGRKLTVLASITCAVIALVSPAVLAVPLTASEQGIIDQTFLRDVDPLKDFVSGVTHDQETASPSSNATTTIPSPSPRFSVRVKGLDNIFVESRDGTPPTENSLTRPSWFTSTLMARRMLALSSVGVASTVYPQSHSRRGPPGLEGVSISLPEYIADCETVVGQGNQVLLGLYVSTTFQNVASGSNISLSIDWWNHINKTSPLYPDFPLSAAGLPRMSLLGYVERFQMPIENKTRQALESCFLASHPDAAAWLPGNPDSPHAGFWAKMIVTQVYWIGGFGDIQQIGWFNMTEWRSVGKKSSPPGIGDGRGWDDVRLPGEKA